MESFALVSPIFALAATAAVILVFFHRRDEDGRSLAGAVAVSGCLAAAFLVLAVWPEGACSGYSGFLRVDDLGSLASLVATLAAAVTAAISGPYLRKAGREPAEIYVLLLLGTAGMVAMVQTSHLVTFFVGLETMSLALYVLSASLRERRRSIEAGMKYFLAGA